MGYKPMLPAHALPRGERLFRLEPRFLWAAKTMADLPPTGAPEVCFAGRSNVGKSSLVNALVGRKGLARASSEPGRTRELIFFGIAGKDEIDKIRIVDLPGYGHAVASKTEIARWNEATRDFLRGRVTLKRAFVLIDSRHGLKPNDLEVMSLLDASALAYQIILTKIDKLKKGELEGVVEQTREGLKKRPAAHPEILPISSHEQIGIDRLREEIANFALDF
ncbi:putative GTP-binding protein EngB [Candidatus Phycosocius spiralis]|uniref:Probable GTP-binding protein EngB n=2 Tax=Candidatus Phycosocius spiralis TaxID=2815099 RepID=A0ABQ4PW48_9PROT|nr:putative GTP-binding protein EngB [Candidatus Phycosocius spiralis]